MQTKSILLIEDNSDDEELTILAFRKNDISTPVVVARDGAEALELLFGKKAAEHPAPSIVLLDINLPKIDGIEILQRIRSNERTRFLPVIVLSSSCEEQDVHDCYSLGCNSYVRKPVNFPAFVEAARHLGLYWLLLNEPPPTPN